MAMKMAAPKLLGRDETSLSIKWDAVTPGRGVLTSQPGVENSVLGLIGYKIRFRRENDLEWSPLSDTVHIIKTESVKKKNLLTNQAYYFSVIPVFESNSSNETGSEGWGWSPSSEKLIPALALSPLLQQMFPPTLMKKTAKVSSAEVLQNKVIGVYFSASWCGPCRSFTPLLAQVYQQAKEQNKAFEIIFVSADHNESEFLDYYQGHHPWLALDYSDSLREGLMGRFNVSGIPRLAILKPSGEVLVDNAGAITVANVDSWISKCGL